MLTQIATGIVVVFLSNRMGRHILRAFENRKISPYYILQGFFVFTNTLFTLKIIVIFHSIDRRSLFAFEDSLD